MGRGAYETTNNPQPAPTSTPNARLTLISTMTTHGETRDIGRGSSQSISRFAELVNHSRLNDDEMIAGEDGFVNLGRGGYDITNSPKPAPPQPPRGDTPSTPKPRPQQPRPEQPQNY
ncbi:hypothetical protein PG989_001431 [Apiospora arundinis]